MGTSTTHSQIEILRFDSPRLKDNPLGDPSERNLPVYLPAAYNNRRRRNQRFPVLYALAAYTNTGPGLIGWRNFDENLPQRLDRLIRSGKMPPCIVVFPDCFTTLGGNQYLNSSAIGPYADYLTRELIPLVDKTLRTHPDRTRRGCFGKSSGGYGAMLHGMKYAKYWGAVANHSGDAYFDFLYRCEWPAALTHLQNYAQPELRPGQVKPVPQTKPGEDDGRIRRFLAHRKQAASITSREITTLMMVCMAATYDPDPRAPNGFALPYDLQTGEFLPARWRRWLRHDPVKLVGKYTANLKSLRALYVDCGWRDQYHIHFGARQLVQHLSTHNVAHRYEEFDGTHSGIDHRLDISLPYLLKRLK